MTASDGGGIRTLTIGRESANFRNNNPSFVGEWDENDQLDLRQVADVVTPVRDDPTGSFLIRVHAADFGDVLGPRGTNSSDLEITFEMQE